MSLYVNHFPYQKTYGVGDKFKQMYNYSLSLKLTVFRYSGAGDELISPVYIAPTLPPYVERTWPEDEVAFLELHIIRF